ncbi:MAG: rRNA adenine dimethyltransferase family protein [Candidatus Daviesbacteria bacterium]
MEHSKEIVMDRLNKLGVRPNENIGQHFLVDDQVVNFLAGYPETQDTVLEIGVGVGQLTERLAVRAHQVIGIEIDRRFEPVLEDVIREHPNVKIVFGDALSYNLDNLASRQGKQPYRVISNLPYHITEPFIHKLALSSAGDSVLVVGRKFALSAQATSEESPDFGALTLLANTFFDVSFEMLVKKESIYPSPRAESTIIRLTPHRGREYFVDQRLFLLRRLFLTSKMNPLVKNALKEGLIDYYAEAVGNGTLSKSETNRKSRRSKRAELREFVERYKNGDPYLIEGNYKKDSTTRFLTQNSARSIIDEMNIPLDVLNKSFSQLNNSEMRILSKVLKRLLK